MRSCFLNLLTTTAVVIHALLGCCAHHAHAEHSHRHDRSQVAGHPHDHAHSCSSAAADAATDNHDRSDDHDGSAPGEPCDEPDCQFVTAQRCDEIESALSAPVWVPLADAVALPTSVLLDSWCETGSPPDRCLAEEPLRAVTQVWLL